MKICSFLIAALSVAALNASASDFRSDVEALTAGENRLSGLPGNEAAAQHVASRLAEIGVDEVFVQTFPSTQVIVTRCEMLAGGNTLPLEPVRPNGIVPPASPPEGITGRILRAGAGQLSDYGSRDPEGAIVVLNYDTGGTWLQAFRLGAAAVVFVSEGEMNSGHAHFVHANANLPRFFYNGNPADLTEGRQVTIHSQLRWEPVLSTNVFGLIRGTDPQFYLGREELMILGTQLDTFGEVPALTPGARGAANVAGLLGVAEELTAAPPRRHTLVSFFNNEARGFEGTRVFYRAIDRGIREAPATLESREDSLRGEINFLTELQRTLLTDDPLAAAGPLTTQLFNRMRLAADEEIENSRADMGDLRQEIDRLIRLQARLGEDDPQSEARAGTLAKLRARLEAMEKPHIAWNDFRRALARGELESPAADYRYGQVVGIVRTEVDARLAELEQEEIALDADKSLHAALANFHPVLHLTTQFGDGTGRWGLVFGRSSRMGSQRDESGLYGRILQAFKDTAAGLAQPLAGFDDSAINPDRQLYGGEFLMHGGEIAGRYGIFNSVVATVSDQFPREGTPVDTIENLNIDRLEQQMREFAVLIAAAGNSDQFSTNSPIVRHVRYVQPRFRETRMTGSLAMRRTRGSSIANRPAAGAIVQVFVGHPGFRLRSAHTELLYTPRKPVAFDNFIVTRAAANGALTLHPLNAGGANEFGVGMLFDDQGMVTAINEQSGGTQVASRLNLLPVRNGALVPPPHMLAGFGEVLNGRTNSTFDLGRSFTATHDGVVYWYVEEKTPSIKVFGTRSAVAMNIGEKSDLIDSDGSFGIGLPMHGNWKFPRTSLLASSDLLGLNDERLSSMRSRGVSNLSVEDLNARALDLQAEVEPARDVAASESLALSSFLTSLPVYENVRRSLDDLVKSVLILLALAVPFAFALERLLIGSPSIYKQITWFVSFFIATFLLLYLTHPAFAVSNAPMIIFLGFAIIVLSGLVIFIIMQKFEIELKRMQGMAVTVHSADVSRFSTVMAAMSMGISTMRRRPVRTALTATTIILLTFTILCFASFGGSLGVAQRFIAPLPGYSGLLIHRINWGEIDPAILDVIKGRLGPEDTMTTRYWISPQPLIPGTTALARGDGSNPAHVRGVLGIDAGEFAAREDFREVLGEPGGDFENSIWLTEAIAGLLEVSPGESVRLNGRTLTVAPLVNASRLNALRDMDGSAVVPVDFAIMQSLMGVDAATMEATDDMDLGGQSWETLPPDDLVIVSASVARSLFATLRAITIYTEDTTAATRLAEEAARMLRTPVAATRDDSVYWHVFGNVLAASGARDLLLPIVLGGLVVFGTMLGSVADREKEIYTFSALGLAPPHVASLFFAEALVFSVIGGLGGYLTAQAVLEGLKWLATFGLAVVPEINYSSTNAIITILIVMGTVMISAIYPAIKASRSANPGVMRGWRMPDPKGDVCNIIFPFTVSAYDITGVVSFLKEHFENFQDTSLGTFLAKDTRVTRDEKDSLGVSAHLALAPFDLGVTQEFALQSSPSEIPGIDEVTIRLERLSGQPGDWKRLNKTLLNDLRKQFLIWRSLPAGVMESYRMRTLQAINAEPTEDTDEEG